MTNHVFQWEQLSSVLHLVRFLVQAIILDLRWYGQGGSVKITSSDPFGQVLIDPALLSAPVDAFMAREGVRLARKYFAAHAWDGYVISEAAPTANSMTDDELDAVLRENVGTVTHLAGSVAMSAKDAPYGVVDPDLKVKKVQGVRVVDASIMVSAKLISFAETVVSKHCF